MTIIKGTQAGYTIGGLPQTYSFNEGTLLQVLSPITVTNNRQNYGDYFHATFEIVGTAQSAAIILQCTALNGLTFNRVGDTYTLSSRYIKNGVQVNNQPYFKIALQSLILSFTNSDISQSFAIQTKIWAGTNDDYTLNTLIANQNININIISVPDMTGIPQTKTGVAMAVAPKTLAGYGMASVQIADPNQAAKTYRVTFTAANQTNGSGSSNVLLWYRDTANGISGDFQPSFTLSGTQAYINSVLAGTTPFGTLGFAIGNYSANYSGTYGVNYVQEVLTSTEPGAVVPYVQETGALTFSNTFVPVWTPNNSLVYNEDETLSGFALGTLTDSWGTEWPSESYTVTASVIGTYPSTNPMVLTYSGDGSVDQVVTFTGTKATLTAPGHPLQNLTLIPPADHSAPISVNILITSNIGTAGVTTRYNQNTTIAVGSTHGDFSLTGAKAFVIGANSFNFGSITDLATSKNYSVTMDFETAIAATLSSLGSGGTSTWNATGGLGFGRLTLTGTKTQVNSHLSTINYTTTGGATLADFVNIIYTQTQTTNSVIQGIQGVFVGNTIQWGAGNGVHEGQSAFVYDQDVAMTWDLAVLGGQLDDVTSYTAKLVFNTPLSVANLGSVTGWTRETDLVWTLTGTKATLNAALAAVVFNPPAQLLSNFTLDIKVFNGVTLVASSVTFGSTKTVYIRTPVTVTWDGAALSYDQDTVKTFTNLATLNSNFNAGTYTLELVTSVATGGSIAGWTTVNTTTFSKTDTKANLQAALNSLVFTPGLTLNTSFTFTLKSYRSSVLINTSVTKIISIGTVYQFNNTATALTFDQDSSKTWAPFGTFSANFDPTKTYTVEIVTSLASVGTFTGWTQTSTTVHSRTGTGATLITAMNSLEFNASLSNQTAFTITTRINRSATLLSTSVAKSINAGLVYLLTSASTLSFKQDRAETYTSKFTLNSNYNNSKTYTAQIILSRADAATFTGWTAVSSTVFTKTDTGTNLISALNNLEMTSSLTSTSNFILSIDISRTSTTISTSSTGMNITDIYSATGFERGYSYGVGGSWNWGSLSSWLVSNGGTLTATLVANTPSITITGGSWTSVTDQELSFSGSAAALQTALNSVTVTPAPYYSGNFTTTLTVKKGGITIVTANQSVVAGAFPEVTFNSNTNISYIIGAEQDYTNNIALVNIPNDGSTYRLRFESPSDQVFGNVTTPGLTWTQDGNSSVSAFATKPVLDVAITDIKLFTKTSSTLQETTPTIRYSIEGPAPFVTKSTAYVNARNAARISGGLNNFTASRTSTTTIPIGVLARKTPGGDYFLDPATTYTLRFELGTTGISITDWIPQFGNVYSISGTPSQLDTAMSAVTFVVNTTAGTKNIFLKVYQSTNYLFVRGYTLYLF